MDMNMHPKMKRITRYGRKPRTVHAVLTQARDFLVEEGEQRWTKGTEWDGDVEGQRDPALCGSWKACAIGVVGMVAGDFRLYYGGVPDTNFSVLSDEAIGVLDGLSGGSITSFNDRGRTTRKDVIGVFNAAIAATKNGVPA